ncbi:acylneuraminate cytidylyltransferase family protein [Gramella sp. GC03-9]|uniref:Acylneuraminate cytidylyltransferase family protein n=1 Tax=Christiangramia oceanisediminis TaxID=2920386 RepID=A0A9X2I974_9FLAO|nr:acylneuraminate cytidylyltransferase family protein [Gramella oceanisediminis]MCP9198303.1 acylneuraminate cytidylyltransferase family protein [Gramella oceanisediminis]
MKILGLITARGGSKGIPGKNIKLLGEKPLIVYSIDAAKKSKLLSRLVVSSDDESILAVARENAAEVPFKRPAGLAADDTPSLEVIKHALQFFKEKNEIFEAVCLLQPTTPYRREGLIDEAIARMQMGNYDSVISVREIPAEYNPHWAFEEQGGQLKIATGERYPIPRRQELPRAYHRDGAVYVTRTESIFENSLLGDKIGFVDTTMDPYVNIDTPSDWKKAEELQRS